MERVERKRRSSLIITLTIMLLLGFFTAGSWAQGPYIVSQTPGDKVANVPTNTTIKIQFSTSMDTESIWIDVWDEYDQDVAGTVRWSTNTYTNDTLIFTPSNALRPATHYSFEGNGQSASGGGVWFEASFITKFSTADATPPTVQTVYPYGGMTGVKTTTGIYIKFSEAMNPGTINSNNITISGLTSSDYAVMYDFEEGGVDIKKNTPFAPSSPYTVTITTNVKDLRGNWLKEQYQWSFTTGAADTTIPTVLQTIPASSDQKVNDFPQIQVIFSEEMDESTLSPSNITLYNVATSSGVPIDIYWKDRDIAGFGPQSPLTDGHTYRVTIGTGVKDLAGNALSSPYTWSFTVAGAGVDSDPMIHWGTSSDSQRGMRNSDGSTGVSLEMGAWDDRTSTLTITATTPGHAPWNLTKTSSEAYTDEYTYESTSNEGLSPGIHILTFTIKDGASPQNTVTFQRNIFIFDSSPILSSPVNGATSVSTTPTFQYNYTGTLRPLYYQVAVFDGPNVDTARMIWTGYVVDKGSGTHSVTIPADKSLAPNTTYYWGVRGTNFEENGETYSELLRSFTTGGTAPPLPIFSWVRVRSDDRLTGMQWNVGAKVVGPGPADIRELKVTGPADFQYIFTEDDIVQGELNGIYFWRNLTNTLPYGTYTFTVTDSMGRISTSNWLFTPAPPPSRVDSSTMSPSNNAYIGTTTPTFSWGGVGAGYSYRIMIMDWNGQEAEIYTSPYTLDTYATVPSGYLLPDTPYKWRVEVFDSSRNNRSVSNTLCFSTASYPYTLDIQGITWSDNTYYSGNRRLFQARVFGPLPTQITSLTVTGPGDFSHTFTESEIRWSHVIGNVYVYSDAGLPADGTYDYNVTDVHGGSDSFSEGQTSTAIPIVDLSSLAPSNNAYLGTLTPTFTWLAVQGSPRYYRISILDWKERYIVYQSLRSTELFATVPEGVLKSERSYKWRVEVFDDPDGIVADNRSSSAWYCFTTLTAQQKPGDSNGDGQTTIDEVQRAINEFLGIASVQPCNDLNGDGQVKIDEVQKVINAFLGINP